MFFIDFNTENQIEAKNSFEKDLNLFKRFTVYAPYGKSLENARKHIDLKLVTDEKKLLKLTTNPRLKHYFVYNEDLFGLPSKSLPLR